MPHDEARRGRAARPEKERVERRTSALGEVSLLFHRIINQADLGNDDSNRQTKKWTPGASHVVSGSGPRYRMFYRKGVEVAPGVAKIKENSKKFKFLAGESTFQASALDDAVTNRKSGLSPVTPIGNARR